jgi:DNA-binding response OmpR family regulator
MALPRILVVDDELDLAWTIQISLRDEGYEVYTAGDGIEAITQVRRYHPHLIVLDIAMPRLDGIQTCQRLRLDTTTVGVPIIFLTVRSAVDDRLQGFRVGADDYLDKPFDLRELKARIRALLRRSNPSAMAGTQAPQERPVLEAGGLTLDADRFEMRANDEAVQLTKVEFDLMCFLMTHPGHVFSSQMLLEQVWGYPPGSADPGLVRWHVKNLRTKLDSRPGHSVHIRTMARHGYVLENG